MGQVSRTVTICNQRGLHARASARFIAEAGKFDARVTVTRDGETVNADSIMELLMLSAGKGVSVTIGAEGSDAEIALDALCALVERGFDED
ncbi:MAG: HPr family phosphocarrier protein [Alphaproteobacteria bacterium]|nr:HPr family phosphocarrier protein [Alphaproteobacteria bacterium]